MLESSGASSLGSASSPYASRARPEFDSQLVHHTLFHMSWGRSSIGRAPALHTVLCA